MMKEVKREALCSSRRVLTVVQEELATKALFLYLVSCFLYLVSYLLFLGFCFLPLGIAMRWIEE